jgi:hypothetical protein
MKASQEYAEAFKLAFAKPDFSTDKGWDIWSDLELISDALAGPLYSVLESGNCNYIYYDKNRFPGVRDTESFINWAVGLVDEYRNGILAFNPANPEEEKDKKSLLAKVDTMRKVVNSAEHEITKWKNT